MEGNCRPIMYICDHIQSWNIRLNLQFFNPTFFICILNNIKEYRTGNMLLQSYLVIVNLVGSEVPGEYYEMLCVLISEYFYSYEEEVTEEYFIVLTFLSSMIDALIT